MQHTPISLTETEQQGPRRLAQARGATFSTVIRGAVARYLQSVAVAHWRERRLAAFGLCLGHPVGELAGLTDEERFDNWDAAR